MNKLALPLLMLTFMLFPATGSAAPPEGVEAEVLVGPVSFPKTTAGTESPAVEIDVRTIVILGLTSGAVMGVITVMATARLNRARTAQLLE